jgi:hypothetical protein
MKRSLLAIFILVWFNCATAQLFQEKGGILEDYNGNYYRQTFLIQVYDLPIRIDTLFGLEKICLNISHPRVSDLKVTLESPDGTGIWLTNRNGRDTGKNYINTCFSSNNKNGYIHEATAPFTGEFIPDGRMEYINNGQNPNGYWKLIIEDLKEGISGILDSFSLQFGKHPAKLKIIKRCSFENPELCLCDGDKQNGEMLPDLVIVPSFTENQIAEYASNDSIYPGQLRFAATIANIGYGPMEIKGNGKWFCGDSLVSGNMKCGSGENSRQQLVQRIYYKENNELKWRDKLAGTMYLEDMPGHNHYHVDNWVEFRLVKMQSKKKRTIVSKGHKVSYCLFSTGICNINDKLCNMYGKQYGETMPNYGLGSYADCRVEKQGITVGGYDTYGMMYEGQYLNLPKGLKNGEYWLEIEIDPDRKYVESNRSNNIFKRRINIQKQQL